MMNSNNSPILRSEGGGEVQQGGNRGGVRFRWNTADIQRLLECPVCYEVMLPPITVCEQGHLVCNSCKERLRNCPVCRGEFTQIRNLWAERFVEMYLVACRYSQNGCRVVLPGKGISEHIKICSYRPLICHSCKQVIPDHQFLEHLQNDEQVEKLNVSECITGFKIEEHDLTQRSGPEGETIPVWEPIWLHAHGQHFFCFLETRNNQWWIWVGAYGMGFEECQKYVSSVTVWNNEAKTMEKFVGSVHSIRASPQDVLDGGRCLSFRNEYMKTLMYNGGIDVHVKIDMEYHPPVAELIRRSFQRAA